MSELTFHYSIRSALPGRAEEPAALGAKFVDALDALTHVDQLVFTNWEVVDLSERTSEPLAAARIRIATIVRNNVTRDDFRQPEPYYGYGAVAFTNSALKSRQVSLRIKAGGGHPGDTWLQAGDFQTFPDGAIVTYARFKAAMLAINAIWPPRWASADAFRLDYDKSPLFPSAPLFPYSRFHIPWFAYLSAPLAVDLRIPSGIYSERTADGGLLMVVTEERLDPTNPEHLQRARVLAEIMIERTGYRPGGVTRT